MKKFLRGGMAALMFLAIVSCSSDDDNDSAPDNNQGTITAKINGQPWTGEVSSVTLIRVEAEGAQRFDISAEDDDIRLLLAATGTYTESGAMTLGTYTFPQGALFVPSYKVNGNYFGEHMPEEGTMIITAVNPGTRKISGTFSFVADKAGTLQNQVTTPEVLTVTEGQFTNLTYTVMDL